MVSVFNQLDTSLITLNELRPGAVFVTAQDVYAVKSEYYYAEFFPVSVHSTCKWQGCSFS